MFNVMKLSNALLNHMNYFKVKTEMKVISSIVLIYPNEH
jgi:hypothetical protein